ncbi:hypothetical protein GCM10022226_78490 [Sphaerisporangium flaviroseum]|uniref:DOD-type homing endonuclease domain-containing protein n=1 Tax=Sphaerisporangium flaviroseum TaxID=509199 RepID=A0ABP7JGU4_9ACTN
MTADPTTPRPPTAGLPRPVAPRRGWKRGRVAHIDPGAMYLGTSVQVAGLFPWVQAGSLPVQGVPIGPDLLNHELVCIDPPGWVGHLTTNPSLWIQGQPGSGKALDLDTPIPTSSGWSTMGTLGVGDEVFDEQGRPTPVIAVSQVMTGRTCLEVVFSDDSTIVADAEHLWVTQTVADRLRECTDRSRPPRRRPVGNAAEVAAVRQALAATTPRALTTIAELSRELGWHGTGRGWDLERMYRWTADLQGAGRGPGGRRLLDRGHVLAILYQRLTRAPHDQRHLRPSTAPISTAGIAATLTAANGKANHAIAVCPPLQLPEADLLIDPYVLGAWLGDGHSDAARITTADPQILEHIHQAGYRTRPIAGKYAYAILGRTERRPRPVICCVMCGTSVRARHHRQRYCGVGCAGQARRRADFVAAIPRTCPGCGVELARTSTGEQCWRCWQTGTFRGQLRAVGVLGDKHIPPAYLRASPGQRAALLAGLLDTDGTISPAGQVQYTTTNPQLATDVHGLVCSLGHRATIRQGRARLNGRDCGPQWTISFTTAVPVFRLLRKHAAQLERAGPAIGTGPSARTCRRYITQVRPVRSRPVRCIQVASPSGMFLAGSSFIATHNSAIAKKVCLGLVSFGYTLVVPGDVKGEYAALVAALGGQVVRIGRGLDAINPLDSGPLGRRLPSLAPAEADRVRAEINGRRGELLHALLATAHGLGRRPTAVESSAITTAVALAAAAQTADPTIPQVVGVLRQSPQQIRDRLLVSEPDHYIAAIRSVVAALENLCSGPLAGLFDRPTTTSLDLDRPALAIDLSALLSAGDQVVAAGLLASWAYSYTAVDTARAFGLLPRPVVLPLDELWRALRAGPGMVAAMDAITRLNRSKGEISLMITHSLQDLEALPTEEDRNKARGLMERCDTLILAAMPVGELRRISDQRPLTGAEIDLIASWAAPSATGLDSGQIHPGRGRYLVKIGGRIGVPVKMHLTPTEQALYDTDAAMRSAARWTGIP